MSHSSGRSGLGGTKPLVSVLDSLSVELSLVLLVLLVLLVELVPLVEVVRLVPEPSAAGNPGRQAVNASASTNP